MKTKNIKNLIIMLAVGLFFITIDFNIYTGISYPHPYSNSDKIIGETQYYTIASTYGATCSYKVIDSAGSSKTSADDSANISSQMDTQQTVSVQGNSNNSGQTTAPQYVQVIDKVFFKSVQIDVLSDFIGFLLIGFACLRLSKVRSKFRLATTCSLCGFVLNGIIYILPFVSNGLTLCNLTLAVGFTYLVCTLITIYSVSTTLLTMCQDVCCRDERKWCNICCLLMLVLLTVTTFVFWLGSDLKMLYNLGIIMELVLAFTVILFWIILYRTKDYIQATWDNAVNIKAH